MYDCTADREAGTEDVNVLLILEVVKMVEKVKMRITYGKAVKNVSDYMDSAGNKFTAFDGSTALAIMFNLPKERTLKDILDLRGKKVDDTVEDKEPKTGRCKLCGGEIVVGDFAAECLGCGVSIKDVETGEPYMSDGKPVYVSQFSGRDL